MKLVSLLLVIYSIIWIADCSPKTGVYTIEKDLSDIEHHQGTKEHDTGYDHEAFLGKERAKDFEKMTPEEGKRRLKILAQSKIDLNKDGKIDKEEMSKWIKYSSQEELRREVDDVWKQVNPKNKPEIDFKEFILRRYGDIDSVQDPKFKHQYEEARERERRRWRYADANGDNLIDKDEFFAFHHPEEDSKMSDCVIEEHFETLDKDKNGVVTKDEYFLDLRSRFSESDKVNRPAWYDYELEHFSTRRDFNKDDKLDKKEIRKMVIPDDYDHVKSETAHLFGEADTNKDNFIDFQELIDKYTTFAGGKVTQFGDILKKTDL